MKKIQDMFLFTMLFVVLELLMFTAIYTLHTIFTTKFSVFDAIAVGAGGIWFRLLSYQLPLQFVFMLAAGIVKLNGSYLIILATSMVALALSIIYIGSYQASGVGLEDIFDLFKINDSYLGGGSAIFISVTLVYAVYRYFGFNKLKDK
ncbi:hypothetical protein [Pseudoteredinibacter isoporae]|uniref:hypothetical protein n=1 Tax=Pseudoteredinibacter isoporae TaxID=570281 RepID=UPI00333E3B05